MGDGVTIGDLKRLGIGDAGLIAGQEKNDIDFTGGTISGVIISGSTIVGDITGNITGNAATATALQNGRTISITGDIVYTSPLFTGSGNIAAAGTLATVNGNVGSFGSSTSIPSFTVNAKGLVTAASGNVVIAPAGTLTGTALAAGVTSSSLTSFGNSPTFVTPALGTPASGVLTNCTGLPLATGITGMLAGANGGTGVSNSGKTITLGGSLTTSGAFASTFTMTNTTSVTFPTTGTLATLAGVETLTNKTLTLPVFTNGLGQIGQFSRDVSLAGGTQDITGLPFQPKSVIIIAGVNGSVAQSFGMDDGTSRRAFYGTGAGVFAQNGTYSIAIYSSGTVEYDGYISTMLSTGFRITWVKTGSTTGTINALYMAFP